MKQALIDTDLISRFLRGHPTVTANFTKYIRIFGPINFSIISYYEILSGLRYRDARRQLAAFFTLASNSTICPVTTHSISHSADIYAALRRSGNLIDDIDILIAGIAVEHDFVLVSHNIKHFSRIDALVVEDWSSDQGVFS